MSNDLKSTLKKSVKVSENIEKGYEGLYREYKVKSLDKEVYLIDGNDGGSTGTRACLTDGIDEFADLYTKYVLPSTWGRIIDNSELIPDSDKLIDNLDCTVTDITDLTIKPKEDRMFEKIRSIRGSKLDNSKIMPKKITSTVQKIDDETFYLNIIENIVYGCVQKYEGKLPKNIVVYVGAALPPGEQISRVNKETFTKRLKGTYSIFLTDYNVMTTVKIEDTVTLTEPESFAYAYAIQKSEGEVEVTEVNQKYLENKEVGDSVEGNVVNDQQQDEDEEVYIPELALHIDVGGRSTGLALLVNGKSSKDRCRTLDFGGTQLASALGDLLVDNYGGRKPSQELLERALVTGKIKFSKIPSDVSREVREVKNTVAEAIFKGILDLIADYGKVKIESLEQITMSGGTTRKGDYGYSIAEPLYVQVSKLVDDVTLEVVEDNFIPLGMLYKAYEEFGDDFEEHIEDTEDEE